MATENNETSVIIKNKEATVAVKELHGHLYIEIWQEGGMTKYRTAAQHETTEEGGLIRLL